MSRVVLLGPQAESQTLEAVVADLGLQDPIATVTAGWRDWESDDALLNAQLGGVSRNLRLYARAEQVWADDPELRAGHRQLQDRLRRLRTLYNRRLVHLANDWMELLADPGPQDLLDPERKQALKSVQALDAHHLQRIADERSRFQARFRPGERDAVRRARREVAQELQECSAVVVEGGHVAVLHNRLTLFDLPSALEDRTVIGCSGGAMVLGERVVLFHDTPPWGPGHSEVALPGLGLHHGLVPLPHARTRLRLTDRPRLRRLALRLAPAQCVVLEGDARLDWDGAEWTSDSVACLSPEGDLEPWKSAA